MKNIFIPIYSNSKLNEISFLKYSKQNFSREISIFYSIQYENLAKKAKELLEKNNFKILNCNQILGCSKPIFKENPKTIILFSNGKFHAISLYYETKIPVILFDSNKFEKISSSQVSLLEQKKNKNLLKFLNSKKIGILISTKPGQQRYNIVLEKIKSLEKKYPEKNFFLFFSNLINIEEFQNFDIDCFINSACPRLDMTHNLLHLNDLKKLEE